MTGQQLPTRGPLRGAALAVTSTTLAITAHAVAGGGLPDTTLSAFVTVGVLTVGVLPVGIAAVGVGLADRRRSPGVILAVLAGAQLATQVSLALGTVVRGRRPRASA